MVDDKKIKGRLRKIQKEIQKLPPKIGKQALKHFDDSFENQGFLDKSVKKWAPRKQNISKHGKKEIKPNRAILILTGEMRRSLGFKIQGKDIVIYLDKDYAKFHNEGTPKLPKRQFMGDSVRLKKKIIRLIGRALERL